jgi:hypothetical protein
MATPKNPFARKLIVRTDTRTAAEVDANVRAYSGSSARRVADRPVVRISAARLDARIARYSKTLRMKRPKATGA